MPTFFGHKLNVLVVVLVVGFQHGIGDRILHTGAHLIQHQVAIIHFCLEYVLHLTWEGHKWPRTVVKNQAHTTQKEDKSTQRTVSARVKMIEHATELTL